MISLQISELVIDISIADFMISPYIIIILNLHVVVNPYIRVYSLVEVINSTINFIYILILP